MKTCSYCGRENDEKAVICCECGTNMAQVLADDSAGPIFPRIKLRWMFYGLLFVALLAAYREWLSKHAPPRPKQNVVVLASWLSNGQQVVTFRPDPPDAEITFAGVASAFDDGSVQPATLGSPGFLVPQSRPDETNFTLRFLATPLRRASMGGKPLAFTPGTYTVAYTPQQAVNRLRVGIALQHRGMADIKRRIFNAWAQKSLVPLCLRSHEDPVFAVTQPFTNTASSR